MTTIDTTGLFCTTTVNYISGGTTTVDVRNGRTADLPGWQACGFELVSHPSTVTDWADDDQVAALHYPEIEALAKEMTGADHALVSSHIKRNPDSANRHHQLSPIKIVHSDFAEGHAGIVRRSYTGQREGGERALERNGITSDDVERARRLVILQFWRNVGPPKMDYPLAFCDARTIEPQDARAFPVTNYAGSGADFEAIGILPPTPAGRHGWYAFPQLRDDEAVAFRTYDTELVDAGEIFFTPHTAIRDPEVEEGKPARSSIELRATCLFV